jgi:hypothetical protein
MAQDKIGDRQAFFDLVWIRIEIEFGLKDPLAIQNGVDGW